MGHRKWSQEKGCGLFSAEVNEHNALYDAWEVERDRADDLLKDRNAIQHKLDEARKYIAELEGDIRTAEGYSDKWSAKVRELESRPVLTWEECEKEWMLLRGWMENGVPVQDKKFLLWLKTRLPAPTSITRVPFNDAQIERMAVGLRQSYCEHYGITADGVLPDYYKELVRAALAAGGLEPCAVPDYDPDDVALAPRGHVLRNRLVEAEAKIERQRAELKRLNAMVAELRAQPSSDTGQLPADQVEALARVLNDAYQPIDGDNPISRAAGTHWPRMARAAIAHIAKRPEGLPTAEGLRATHRQYIEAYRKGKNDGSMCPTDFALEYLRPWLRDPVGFELDVTAKQMMELYYEKGHALPSMQAVLDLCRSRISPVYECKECAKLRDDVTFWKRENVASNNKMLAARAALEVDSNKIETAYGTLRCSLEHQQKLHAAALEIAMAEPKENE